MAKKTVILNENQKRVKDLIIGDVVNINMHDYYFKGIQEVRENGTLKKQVAFWSITTDFKKYFNLELLEHIVTLKTSKKEDGYNW